jgi:hypothetical protein
MVETEARSPAERPGIFILTCGKCTLTLELHGREDILSLRVEAAGWSRDGDAMVCPKCPAPREQQAFNRAREQQRRMRRAGACFNSLESAVEFYGLKARP